MTPKLDLSRYPPQLQLALQLGLGTLMAFAGMIMVLSTLGVIQPDENAGPAARTFAFLVGALVAAFGATLILSPLRELATARGAKGDLHALWLGLRTTLGRVDLSSAVAAASMVPLAAGAWFGIKGTTWLGPDAGAIIDLVVIEFLLIHGFVFLAFAATVARSPRTRQRAIGLALVVLLVSFYGLFAWESGGAWGLVGLVYLALPNILAFTHADDDWRVRTTAGARWLVKTVTFLGIAALLGHTEIRGAGNLSIALYYFTLQAVVELFRVAEMPLDLGLAFERLPASRS